ncbi:MAG: restriction endonuclease subunit S [Verrucomicrobiota bacterium]
MDKDKNQSNIIFYQTEDGRTKLEVRLEDETVWLTQPLMAELFQTTQQNISLHLRNIYEEGELRCEATHKEFLSVRREGMYGVAITRVTLEKIINSRLPIAPLAEQQAIVERVDKLMAMIDELEKQVSERKEQSEMLSQSVLKEAISDENETV